MKWPTVKLGDICRIELGKTPARGQKKLWDESRFTNNVWLSIADLPKGIKPHVSDSKEYISDEGAELCKIVPSGTLIVSFKLTLGRLAITETDLYTNEAIAALYINENAHIKQVYLYWYLAYFDWQAAAGNDVKVKGKTLNKAKLKEIEVLAPPISEQKRIVTILDQAFADIDRVRALTEQNLKNARELFESKLQQVFSQGGGEWVTSALAEIVQDDCSLSYGIVQPGKDFKNGLPVVRPTDLTSEIIALEGLKLIDPTLADSYKRTTLQGGELLLCVRGSTGVISVASDELEGANVTRGIVPIRFNGRHMIQKFGYYQFISKYIQDQIKAGTYGAALMQINIRDLRKLEFTVPPIDFQLESISMLDEAGDLINKLERTYRDKLRDLDELKKSILQKAFMGELSKDKKGVAA